LGIWKKLHTTVKHKQSDIAARKWAVRSFWDEKPCGWGEVAHADEAPSGRFEALRALRYRREAYIPSFAQFDKAQGLSVLEVGVGAGIDFCEFAKAGAKAVGVDWSQESLALARRYVQQYDGRSVLLCADSETLPFPDGVFDVVYSFGVIHHTPDTESAARELMRVFKPGGVLKVMVYHRRSLNVLLYWLRFALFVGRPLRSFSEILAAHMESPGTKAFTVREVCAMFKGLEKLNVETVVTPYDLRIGRRLFLPSFVRKFVPKRIGFNLLLQGCKPLTDKGQ
jgi:SAM-dependent methyltransferase